MIQLRVQVNSYVIILIFLSVNLTLDYNSVSASYTQGFFTGCKCVFGVWERSLLPIFLARTGLNTSLALHIKCITSYTLEIQQQQWCKFIQNNNRMLFIVKRLVG